MENQETIFERLARERNITVEEMKAIITDRIKAGWNDPDPEKQAQWLRYAVERLREEGLEDLLRI